MTSIKDVAEIEDINQMQEYQVVNSYEKVVKEAVHAMMKTVDMCRCSKCFSDACALVLNQVMPHYVTTRRGELLTQVSQMQVENQVDLTVKVVQALNQVKASPQHV